MFNIADIWKHQSYDNALHYLLLENLGTPPHWYAFNIDKGRYEKIFITRASTGRFEWEKVA